MGYVNRETMTIELPSDPAYYVVIRAHSSMGESEEMARLLSKMPDSEDPATKTSYQLLQRNILDWNLTGEDDEKLPIEPKSFLLLRVPDFNAVFKAIIERDQPERTDEEKNASSAASTAV